MHDSVLIHVLFTHHSVMHDSMNSTSNAESKITTPGKGLHSQNKSLQYTESKLIHGLYTSVSLNVH